MSKRVSCSSRAQATAPARFEYLISFYDMIVKLDVWKILRKEVKYFTFT
jgi:hypothetical protein